MINKAIAKITDEMMKMDDPLAQLIEEHLTEVCKTDRVAERLLDPNKSLKEVHKKVWDEARKRKGKGNGVYIPEPEIYAMVDKYYGITAGTQAPAAKTINVMDLI